MPGFKNIQMTQNSPEAISGGSTGGGGGGGGGSGGLSATSSPTELNTNSFRSQSGTTVVVGPCVVTVIGGVPPYTFDWEQTGGDDIFYADNQDANGSTFSTFVNGLSDPELTAEFTCTITDSVSNTVDAPPCTITVEVS